MMCKWDHYRYEIFTSGFDTTLGVFVKLHQIDFTNTTDIKEI